MSAALAASVGDAEVVLRLALAAGLCALLGLEREVRGQAAGLRTHTLVGLGAALFTYLSAYGFEAFNDPGAPRGSIGAARVDPSRIAAQVVTGIGFLGAGAIIRQGGSVRGLTTAAGLWCAAAVGMAVAVGAYLPAIAVTALALATLVILRPLRSAVVDRWREPDEDHA